jgi:hypothetical protein
MNKLGLLTNTLSIVISGFFSAAFNITLAVLAFFIYSRLAPEPFDNTSSCKGLAIRRLILADAILNSIGIALSVFSTCLHASRFYRARSEYITDADLDIRGSGLSTGLRGCLQCGSLGILVALSVLFWGNTQSCSNVFPRQVYRLVWSYLILNYVFLLSIAIFICLMWCGVGAYTTYYTASIVRVEEEKQPIRETTYIRSTTA